MALLDIIILVILGLFFLQGVSRGLIRVVGGLLGLILGAYFAGQYAGILGKPLIPLTFFIIFILANRLTGLAFVIIGKIFNLVAIIPGLKSINKLAGGLLGIIEAATMLGVLAVLVQFFLIFPAWKEAFEGSKLVPFLKIIGNILFPLFKTIVE